MRHANRDRNWHNCSAMRTERRDTARLVHAERVGVATQWGDIDGRLVDISATGSQVHIANGLVPIEGEEVVLQLVGAGQFAGRVAWANDDAIGIVFDRPVANVGELLWIEQRGPEWYGRAAFARREKHVWG